MTHEAEFLVAALRYFLDPESTLPDAGKIHWNTLLDLAKAHAVTPMLYAALREVPLARLSLQSGRSVGHEDSQF